MVPRVLPPPLSLALTFLREARGWTQQELATAAGLKRQLLCDLEKGSRRTLERGLCESLVAAMGYGPGDVTLALLFVGGVRRAARPRSGTSGRASRRVPAWGA
jgi:transcriptional regulator with XRE-family HTH domain